MLNIITSKENEKVKYIKSLLKRKKRDLEKKYLIEGIRFLEEALDYIELIDMVAYSPKLFDNERGKALIDAFLAKGIAAMQISDQIFKDISATENPQGIMAVIKMQDEEDFFLETEKPLFLVIDGIQDPGNLGTIFRTADAAGIDGVVLIKGTVDIYNPKTLRSTMGSIFRVPVWQVDTPDILINFCREKEITIFVATVRSQSTIYQSNFNQPAAIVLGSEATGPSAFFSDAADENIIIPMPGNAESLNVAVAAGVIVFEAVRQRS